MAHLPAFFSRPKRETGDPPPQPLPPPPLQGPPRETLNHPVSVKRKTISFAGIPEERLDTLSTFDKNTRSGADKDKRISILHSRLKRSQEKVQQSSDSPVDIAVATVDDSLLTDGIGTTARDYERHLVYKGNTRAPTAVLLQDTESAPPFRWVHTNEHPKNGDEDEEVMDEDEDDDDDDQQQRQGNPMDIDDDPVYHSGGGGGGDDNDDDDDDYDEIDYGPKTLIAPGTRVPDTAARKSIVTFEEYVTPNPATRQFENNMRNIKGPEQSMFVEVRKEDAIYSKVSTTLDAKLQHQQIARFAIQRGMALPDLPVVSKIIIQDNLCSPDFEIGERPCVYSLSGKCQSYLMGVHAKRDDPGRYAGVDPFACKEFYFGDKGNAIRTAIAEGTPLSEVQNPEPVMCVLCHLAIVSNFYKRFDMGLTMDPPHILHSFRVHHSVPGEYPMSCMIGLGDKTFKGIIAPYPRYCQDNYLWEPVAPVIVVDGHDPLTHAPIMKRVPSIQRWTERECMDFQ